MTQGWICQLPRSGAVPNWSFEGYSRKQPPIQRAELDRFEHIIGPYGFAAAEISECSCDLEDAVVGAGGEVEFLHRVFDVAD